MRDALRVVLAVIILISLVAAVAIYVGYHRTQEGGGEGDALRTDRSYYMHDESVIFIFRNVWDEAITYDSELRDTLTIRDSAGKAVVMLPPIQTLAFVTLQPNETLAWEWDQTFYLYDVVDGRTEWDPRTGTHVPPGTYTASVEHGDIRSSVSFRILP